MAENRRDGRNRLANEKSPYLLQHADNPVDWYPWGEEAFEKAKREDKPVFLSIGLFALPITAYAQALGSVAGTVRDASGAVLPGVTVEAGVFDGAQRTKVQEGGGEDGGQGRWEKRAESRLRG